MASRKDKKGELHREDVSGELDHASGEVDRVEAGIVAGAGGVPTDETDEELDEEAAYATADAGRRPVPTAAQPAGRGLGRVNGFLRASWAELQRVQWPDRRQVGQATAVVLGFVVIAGSYLGLADYVAGKIVDFIL